MQKKFLIILFSCFSLTSQSQPNVDSLIALYPNQSNREKVVSLGEICYQLAFNDSKKAINYGGLGYKAALQTGDKVLVAQALNDWSIPFLVQGNFDTVLVLCEQALEIRTDLGDSVEVAKLLNKMANANYELGNLTLALQQNLRALRLFEENNLETYAGRVLSNIGLIYEQNGMFEDALETYQKAKEIANQNQNRDAYYIALSSEAACLTKLNRFDEADQKMNDALAYYLETENVDMMAGIYQNLGFNARSNKDSKKGKYYYEKARDMYQINNNETGLLFITTNLAQISMDFGELDVAENYLNEAYDLALKNNSLHQLETIYRGLMRLENLKGNYQKADDYFNLYLRQMDSLYNAETNGAITEMKIKYDTDAKEKALANEQLENKNKQLLLVLAGVLIIILVLLVLLIRHRKKLQSEKLTIEGLRNLDYERRRIARDLHDNLGAELALIASKIDIEAFKNENTALGNALNEISGLSKNANNQLRETIWSTHKSSITLGELGEKIQAYADRILNETQIEIKIITESPSTEISPPLGLNLFRISQEMINNTFKYAEANEILVEIGIKFIQIKDNGIGFNLETVRRGYGLNNIEQRVLEFKGDMKLTSDSNGTTLAIKY